MNKRTSPPGKELLIRCPRLGHEIYFSYCRQENMGLPCFKILDCWFHYFAVEEHLRKELSKEEWEQTFVRPGKPKMVALAEGIAAARKGPVAEGENRFSYRDIGTHMRDIKKIAMNPEDVHVLFHKYFMEQDIEGLGSLFDENAMFIPGKNLDPVFGRENIKQALQQYFDSPAAIENLSKSIHQNGDIALVKSAWRIQTDDGSIEGVALEVMKRLPDGTWVYIIDNPYGI